MGPNGSGKSSLANTLMGNPKYKILSGKILINGEDIKYSGSGCVISLVSASLFTDKIKGMKIDKVKKLSKEDILELLKIKINPARLKCVLLPLESVRGALR